MVHQIMRIIYLCEVVNDIWHLSESKIVSFVRQTTQWYYRIVRPYHCRKYDCLIDDLLGRHKQLIHTRTTAMKIHPGKWTKFVC